MSDVPFCGFKNRLVRATRPLDEETEMKQRPRNQTGLRSWLRGLSPRRAGSAGLPAWLLAIAAGGTAWAAEMPAGSRAWMVFSGNSCGATSTCATSNTPGPNPPNGIPTTTFIDTDGTFQTGSAEILPDRMRSVHGGYGGEFMYLFINDTYTVHGVATGPFEITVHLVVEGVARSVLMRTTHGLVSPTVEVEIGTFNSTTEPLHEQWRVTPFDSSTTALATLPSMFSTAAPFERNLAVQASYSRTVSVGDVFDLGFGVTSSVGWGEIDLLDGAVIRFDLPDGVFLTSALAASIPTCTQFAAPDFDRDCDVDLNDYAAFVACSSGPNVALTAGCEGKDLDLDNDVDQSDFGIFQKCLSGRNVTANAGCMN